jgi:hypothetical protein
MLARMGAWGHESFANDAALDWLGDLTDRGPELISETLDRVANAADDAYLDADDCSSALAAAELVAAAHGRGVDRLTDNGREWLSANQSAAEQVDAALARRAAARVLESSELRELWNDGEQSSEWQADVKELLRRF